MRRSRRRSALLAAALGLAACGADAGAGAGSGSASPPGTVAAGSERTAQEAVASLADDLERIRAWDDQRLPIPEVQMQAGAVAERARTALLAFAGLRPAPAFADEVERARAALVALERAADRLSTCLEACLASITEAADAAAVLRESARRLEEWLD